MMLSCQVAVDGSRGSHLGSGPHSGAEHVCGWSQRLCLTTGLVAAALVCADALGPNGPLVLSVALLITVIVLFATTGIQGALNILPSGSVVGSPHSSERPM